MQLIWWMPLRLCNITKLTCHSRQFHTFVTWWWWVLSAVVCLKIIYFIVIFETIFTWSRNHGWHFFFFITLKTFYLLLRGWFLVINLPSSSRCSSVRNYHPAAFKIFHFISGFEQFYEDACCPSLAVSSTWCSLSFLDLWVDSFHKICKIFSHYFFKYVLLVSSVSLGTPSTHTLGCGKFPCSPRRFISLCIFFSVHLSIHSFHCCIFKFPNIFFSSV